MTTRFVAHILKVERAVHNVFQDCNNDAIVFFTVSTKKPHPAERRVGLGCFRLIDLVGEATSSHVVELLLCRIFRKLCRHRLERFATEVFG